MRKKARPDEMSLRLPCTLSIGRSAWEPHSRDSTRMVGRRVGSVILDCQAGLAPHTGQTSPLPAQIHATHDVAAVCPYDLVEEAGSASLSVSPRQ